MQRELTALANRVGMLETRFESSEEKRNEQHDQNRKDIHDLRGTLQTQFERLSNSFSASIEKMSDRLSENIKEAIKPITHVQAKHEDQIVNLRLQWAKATGYAAAGAVGAGFLFEAAKIGLERILK